MPALLPGHVPVLEHLPWLNSSIYSYIHRLLSVSSTRMSDPEAQRRDPACLFTAASAATSMGPNLINALNK